MANVPSQDADLQPRIANGIAEGERGVAWTGTFF